MIATVGKNPHQDHQEILWSYRDRLTFLNELNSTWTELSDAVNLITNQNNSHEQDCKYKLRRNFHIDEDAYLKLTRYFDAIKRSLSKSSGQTKSLKISRCVFGTVNGKSKNRQTSCRFKRGRPSDCCYGPTRLHYRRG
jgi:hypothetical protein